MDVYQHRRTITNNIKVLEQNNQEYNIIVQYVQGTFPILEGVLIENVEIVNLDKANEYTLVIQKEGEILEVKVSHKI